MNALEIFIDTTIVSPHSDIIRRLSFKLLYIIYTFIDMELHKISAKFNIYVFNFYCLLQNILCNTFKNTQNLDTNNNLVIILVEAIFRFEGKMFIYRNLKRGIRLIASYIQAIIILLLNVSSTKWMEGR